MSFVGDGATFRGFERLPPRYSAAAGGFGASDIYSASVWIKPASLTGEVYLNSFAESTNSTNYWSLWIEDGVVKAFRRSGGTAAVSGGLTLTQDVWQHLGIVLREADGQIWLDGVADAASAASRGGPTVGWHQAAYLRFGGGPTNFGALNGKMGDMAEWNGYALTQQNMTDLAAGTVRPEGITPAPDMRRDMIDNFTAGAGELGGGTGEGDPGWFALGTPVWDALDNPPSLGAGQQPATPVLSLGTTGTTTQVLNTSAYSDPDVDPHLNTDWEVYDDAGLTNLVSSSLADATNLESITIGTGTPAGNNPLTPNTQYWARARHRDDTNAVSDWSNTVPFTTLATTIVLTNMKRNGVPIDGQNVHYYWYPGEDGTNLTTPETGVVVPTAGGATFTVSPGSGTLVLFHEAGAGVFPFHAGEYVSS